MIKRKVQRGKRHASNSAKNNRQDPTGNLICQIQQIRKMSAIVLYDRVAKIDENSSIKIDDYF